MKVVLLAGGRGTRISEESDIRPKPLIEIGGMPIIWHIMKEYSYYGFNDFIICAGYRQEMMKQWFADYFLNASDVTFDMTGRDKIVVHHMHTEPWKVTVVDTGEETMTGGRIRRIKEYIDDSEDDSFLMTYGDGVCDVDIGKLVAYHKNHGRTATLTAVRLEQNKGILDIDYDKSVRAFREKDKNSSQVINAGYMVLKKRIFDYLLDDETVLEKEPLQKLAEEGELMSYMHSGFWQCMDTILEKRMLEKMWSKGTAPWKKW